MFTGVTVIPVSAIGAPLTVSDTVTERVVLPAVPVTVTVDVPVGAFGSAVKVSLADPDPGAEIVEVSKEAVTPDGKPETDKPTAELKLPPTGYGIVTYPS